MKILTLLQSAPIVGPLGWVFGLIAAAAIGLLVRLWLSMSNQERRAMERELKDARTVIVDLRTTVLGLSNRNQELRNENEVLAAQNASMKKDVERVQLANQHLEDTVGQQSALITALTARCARNEKLIMKLYTDLGKDIDLRYIGGDDPDPPPPGIPE